MNKYFKKFFVFIFITFFICFSLFYYKIKQIHKDLEVYQETYSKLSLVAEQLSSKLNNLEKEKEGLIKHKDTSTSIFEQINEKEDSLSNIKNNFVSKEEMNLVLNNLNTILNKDYSYLANNISFNEINKIEDTVKNNNKKLVIMNHEKQEKSNMVDDLDDADENDYLSAPALSDEFVELFDKMYPINSVYISLNGVKPIYGEWELIQDGVILWNTEDGGGSILEPVLPNIESGMGYFSREYTANGVFSYAFAGHSLKASGGSESYYNRYVDFNRYCSLYQGTDDLKAPSILTTIFKRIG